MTSETITEPDEVKVEDALTEEGDSIEVQTQRYAVSSYGADYTVDGLVKRIQNNDIVVPKFQRGFVWDIKESSRFIESLLLGLPVPSIFLTKDGDGKLLVVDGQQRLFTLSYFYDGKWRDGKEFALRDVQPEFSGKTYQTLSTKDRRNLDDAILHATVFKEDDPSPDERGIYEVFNRLNTGGKLLTSQEVRSALNHRGRIQAILSELNQNPAWRTIYGRPEPDVRMRDQELILRFLALLFAMNDYREPMYSFLNDFMGKRKNPSSAEESAMRDAFKATVTTIASTVGAKAFRPSQALNAAVLDAVMVGTARRLQRGAIEDPEQYKRAYEALLADQRFLGLCGRGTASKERVLARVTLATQAFEGVH